MDFNTFVNQVIKLGMQAAKKDYTRKDQQSVLKGSLAGFQVCKGKNTVELADLLKTAQTDSHNAFLNQVSTDEYRYLRGYTLEIEWVCNVVSAALYNQGLPVIINPTARGMITAAKILGVSKLKNE